MLRVHGGVVHCRMASGCRWHGVSGPVLVRLTLQPRSCFPLLWRQLLGAVTGGVEWWFAIVTTRWWWQL